MAIIGFRHIGLKIMSIALAALLWLVVAGEQVVERALRIPLEFTNMPAQLEPVGEPPNLMDVRLRGSSGRLSRIAAGEVVAVVDLQGARPGQRLFHVSASDVRTPFGVEVELVPDPSTPSGFKWSSTTSPPVSITSGTVCTAGIVGGERRPIELVIPYVRQTLGR
jgi:hypothetical protein